MRFISFAGISRSNVEGGEDHPPDCYVRPGEYLHHLYVWTASSNVIVPALMECLDGCRAAMATKTRCGTCSCTSAQYDILVDRKPQNIGASRRRGLAGRSASRRYGHGIAPAPPSTSCRSSRTLNDTGLNISLLFDLILRTIYNAGRVDGQRPRQFGAIAVCGARTGAAGDDASRD